jgi:hypothetical protein
MMSVVSVAATASACISLEQWAIVIHRQFYDDYMRQAVAAIAELETSSTCIKSYY